MIWRRRADSNRRIEVLQTSALTAWLRRPDFRDPGLIVLVPRAGFEPTQANAHGPLKTACLPIPPPRPISEERIIPRVTLRHTGKPPTAGRFNRPPTRPFFPFRKRGIKGDFPLLGSKSARIETNLPGYMSLILRPSLFPGAQRLWRLRSTQN